MTEHLAHTIRIQESPGHGTTIRMRPGGHPENRATHEALVRRGLQSVDEEGYVTATEAGLANAQAREEIARRG